MKEYFGNKASGNWQESGFMTDGSNGWENFENNILTVYSTAVRLEPFEIRPPIDVSVIRHRTKNSPWNGLGFTPAKQLHRYRVEGKNITTFFHELAARLIY